MNIARLSLPARVALLAVAGIALVFGVALLTARGSLMLGVVALTGAAGLAVAFKYPRLALCAYAASIPLETVQIEGFTTISRAVGAAFFVGYVLAYRGIRPESVRVSAWVFVAMATSSLIWTLDQGATTTSVLTLVQLLVITVLIADAVSRDVQVVRPVLWSYAAGACATALLAIAAFLTSRSSLISSRAGAFAEQDVAQFSALMVPAFMFLASQVAGGDRRLLAGIGCTFAGVAVLLSGTRSAWLAIAVALLFAVLPRMRPSQIVSLAIVVGSIALATAQLPGLSEVVTGRVGTAATSGGSGRLDIWAVGLAIIADHPLGGVGYGAFPAAFTADAIRSAAIPGLDVAVLTSGRGSHSILLGTAGELGLLGLLALGWMVVDVLRPSPRPWGPVVQGMILAVLVQALFLDVVGRKQVWLIFGLAFGLDYARRRLTTRAAGLVDGQVVPDQQATATTPVRVSPQPGRQTLG